MRIDVQFDEGENFKVQFKEKSRFKVAFKEKDSFEVEFDSLIVVDRGIPKNYGLIEYDGSMIRVS